MLEHVWETLSSRATKSVWDVSYLVSHASMLVSLVEGLMRCLLGSVLGVHALVKVSRGSLVR